MNRFQALVRWQFSIGLVTIGLLALAFGLAAGPLNASLAGLRPATPVPPTRVPTAVGPMPTAVPSPMVVPTAPPAATAVPEDATVVAVATMQTLLGNATPIPTSTAIPTPPTPTPLVVPAAGPPFELQIPRIGVDAPIEAVGLDRDGAMGTPSGPFRVGWFDLGYYPGEAGSAVIDGHVDYVRVGPAVFWRLGELVAGDKILVAMPPKRQLTFVVERTAVYPFDNAPIKEIFGPSDVPRLNLVTCTGVFDRATRNYDRRLVVFAKLVSSS